MKWMKAFRSWMRVVLPFEWAALLWLAAQILICFALIVAIVRGDHAGIAGYTVFSVGFSSITAFVYGIYRAWYFHPIENRPYGEWLQQMPWSPADPLPLGPLHFVWQDAVVLLMLGLISPTPLIALMAVTGFFMGGYCVSQGIFAVFRQEPVGAYGFLFLLGIVIIGMFRVEVIVGTAIAMCVVAHVSNQRLISRVRRSDLSREARRQSSSPYPVAFKKTPAINWPFGILNGNDDFQAFSQRQVLGSALLLSWLAYALMWHFPFELLERPTETVQRAIESGAMLLLIITGMRLWYYCWNHWPPVSVFGRLAIGKVIIPGFDKVFLFIPVLLGIWFASSKLVQAGFDKKMVVAGAIGCVVWASLGIGPSLRNWHLTGHHRIVSGMRNRQRFETL